MNTAKNTILLAIVLTILFSCSANNTINNKQIQVYVQANNNNKIANIIKNSIRNNKSSNITIDIGNEKRGKNISTINKNIATGHKLTLQTLVKIYKNNKLVFNKILKNSIYSSDTNSYLTNNLQDELNYDNLREKIAHKLLIKLSFYAN